MAIRLRNVSNPLPFDGVLTNTEHDDDKTQIKASSITTTGGKDGNFIRIPDCSDKEYYKDHHILIDFGVHGSVAIWNDDENGHILCWSGGDFYSTQSIPGTDAFRDVAIMVLKGDNGFTVTAADVA